MRFLSFCATLSSLSPLFLILAIRGNAVVPDLWLWTVCAALVAVPSAFLFLRVLIVWKSRRATLIQVGAVEDKETRLSVYLALAPMLPVYWPALDAWRDLIALCVAVAIITLLFWHFRLHYVHFILALLDYRTFAVVPDSRDSPFSRRTPLALIVRRQRRPAEGDRIYALRLSDTLYWEVGYGGKSV